METVQPGKLYAAVEKGDIEEVKEILLHATAEDVNYQATNEVLLEWVSALVHLLFPSNNTISFARTNAQLLQKRPYLETARSCKKFLSTQA